MPGLKDVVKERLLKMLTDVAPESGWKVVVVDKVCCKILSSAMTLAEVMDNGVTLVENLEVHPRQPMPEMDAIYFIRPTTQSIQSLLRDFTGRPTYGHIHLYFSSHLEDSGLALLKENKAVLPRIRTLKELNLEFKPYESQTFLLDTEESFFNLYSPGGARAQEQTAIANKLLTLCVTLNEYPNIRCARTTTNARAIADKLQDKLEQFGRISGSEWRPNQESPATLLILDRSVDALSPLMHEYTYQAMVMDLLGIHDDRYAHTITTGAGQEQKKDMLLNENDAIWAKLRHLFIAEASEQVSAEFKEFMTKNKTAELSRKGGADLSQMSDALRALPEYREQIEKYSLHVTLVKACMDAHSRGGLEDVAKLEQNMAMGEDGEGRPINPREGLNSMLRDPNIPPLMKLRLLMIFIMTQDGLREQDLKTYQSVAQITDNEALAIRGLEALGVSLQKATKKFAGMRLGGGKEKRRKAEDVSYELFRYRPTLHFLVQDLAEDKLSKEEYPYVREPSVSASGISLGVGGSARGGGGAAASARARPKAGWALKNKEKREEETKWVGPRIIICVLGGVTFSEIRSAYELTKLFNREVIIGSTSTLTSQQYLESLKRLASA